MAESKKDKRIEWICRVMLTLQLLLVIKGYVVFLQTKYQLVSPLIPESIIYDISSPHITSSLISSGLMLVSLWLYFVNKKIASIVITGISLLCSELWMYMI